MQQSILLEGLRDYVSLWELVRDARDELGAQATGDSVRERVMNWIRPIVEAAYMEVGDLVRSGERSKFVPWVTTPTNAVATVDRAWRRLGRDPTIGEICWFHNTPRGNSVARTIRQ